MKSKGLVFISCLAAGALIASPALAKPAKKLAGRSMSNTKRMAPHTTQVTPSYRYTQNASPRTGRSGYFAGNRYSGTRSYAGRQYSGTRYFSGNGYYGGSPYYSGGGWGYPYGSSSVWPYVAASAWPYVASSFWTPGYSHYPYSYYGDYPYNYSYYSSGYGYAGSTVAAVQRRLGELGYYYGVVDGVMGPRTRAAIAAYESRHGLVVDGTISAPLLDRLGLA
jgi:hypothetical protein